jgi:hypothetical protein
VTDGSNEPVEFDSRSISTEGTDVVLSVAVDDLAITTEGIAATLEIGDSEISARLDDGGEPVIVSATLPRATVKLANGDVTVSPESEIATPEPPRLPEPITRNSTRFDDQRGSGTSTSTSTTGPPSPPASSATTSPPVTSSPVASTQVRASTVAPSTTAVPTPTALDVGWEPSPPNVANGTGLATIPVRLIDSSGAIVVGDSSTSVVVAIVSESGAQASLSGETSQVAVSGVARFVGLTITGQPGTYHLTFTANVAGRTLTARSITFTMG